MKQLLQGGPGGALLWLLSALAGLQSTAVIAQDQSESLCGSLVASYGPFDYRRERGRKLAVVEHYHFNSDVEHLRKGQSGSLGSDLSYVLRTSPNHHRALAAVSELSIRQKTLQPQGSDRTIDCWFDRAFRFRPDDRVPQLLYIDYLTRMNRKADAMKQAEPLLRAEQLDAFTRNNLGMLMFDLSNYDEALKQCHLAMAEGWERTDLKDRLKAVGRWQEPTPQSADAAASAIVPATQAASAASAP